MPEEGIMGRKLGIFTKGWKILLIICVSALLLSLGQKAHSYERTLSINQTSTGQTMTFTFSNLPPSASANLSVNITLYGDYDSSTEYAQVYVDNVAQTNHPGGSPQCSSEGHENTYSIPAAYIEDESLVVRVILSNSVNMICGSTVSERVKVTVSYTAKPDLYFNSASINSGSTSAAGSTFTLDYVLRTNYESFATNFYTYFYYCPTTSSSGCTDLGHQQIFTNFSEGTSYSFTSPTLTLPPHVKYGSRYLLIRADALGDIDERYETNNSRTIPITITARPDLHIDSSTVPYTGDTIGSGSTFTGRITLGNSPETSQLEDNFAVHYHLCHTNDDSSCTLLGGQTLIQDISPGSTLSYSTLSLTIPDSVVRGTRYLRTVVDANDEVIESNEENNEDFDPIMITGWPDLVPASLSPATTTVTQGKTVEVTYEYTNSGNTSSGVGFDNTLYYSLDEKITSDDQLLHTQSIPSPLTAGSSASHTATVTIPTGATLGSGYIGLITDSQDDVGEGAGEDNNSTGIAVKILEPTPELSMQSWSISPNLTGFGASSSIDFTVANTGTADAGGFFVNFYYSDDSTSTGPFFTYIGKQYVAGPIAEGATATESLSLPLPNVSLAGTRYLHYLIDPQDEVSELDETNNNGHQSFGISGQPDLLVQSLSLNPTTVAIGEELEISYTLLNNGTTRVPDVGVLDGYYYSDDSSILSSDPMLASAPTPQLNAGETSGLIQQNITISEAAQPGTRYLGLVTDYNNMVAETNDTNNTMAASFTCIPPQIDLTLSTTGSGSGVVTSLDGGINCGSDCDETYDEGTSVTLNASADSYSYFKGWGLPCSGAGSCTINMITDTTVSAVFGLRGDYDDDGDVDLADLILVFRILSGSDDTLHLPADTDNSPAATMADGLYILGRLVTASH